MATKLELCLLFGLLLLLVAEVTSYNILFVCIFCSRSHKNAMDPVAQELARKGHNVTFLSSVKETSKFEGIQEVFLPEAFATYSSFDVAFHDESVTNQSLVNRYNELTYSLIDATYRFSFVQELIQNPRNKNTGAPTYDLFVVDAIMNEFVLPIPHNMGIPIVYISPSVLLPQVAWSLNIPSPYSYVPCNSMFMPGQMGFFQKVHSVYCNLYFIYSRFYVCYPKEEEIIRKYLPNAPSLRDLERKISFLLTNDHFSITPRVPNMPYFVEVGGLHLKEPKKLPSDLQDFLDNSGDEGVIYFSLGSNAKGNSMPDYVRQNIIRAFAQLNQKILWKNEVPVKGISSNVKIISWAPQNDVLAHPKLRLFISHGGGLSVQEASYNGKPLLGLPLGAEQASNMANVVNAGFGEAIEWKTLTVEGFLHKIRRILNDTKYKENAERVSVLLKDRREHPAVTAAYWIEYVIRHKGASHLKSGAENVNFFQYFLLDIIGAIAIVVIGIFVTIAIILKKLVSLLRKEQKSKLN